MDVKRTTNGSISVRLHSILHVDNGDHGRYHDLRVSIMSVDGIFHLTGHWVLYCEMRVVVV